MILQVFFCFKIQEEGIIQAILLIVNFKNVLFIHVQGRKKLKQYQNKEPLEILIIIFHAWHECPLPVIGYFIGGSERCEELKRSTTRIRNNHYFMIQFIQKKTPQNTFNHTKLFIAVLFLFFTTKFFSSVLFYRICKKKEIMRLRLTTVLELYFIE